MNILLLSTSVLICLSPNSLAAEDAMGTARAIKFVQENGGTVRRDEKTAGNPVISVEIQAKEACPIPLDLEALTQFSHLKSLSLTCIYVDNDSLQHIKKLTHLENLTLVASGIDDDGVKELKNLENLREVGLGICVITDAGLKSLSELPHLQRIELSSSLVTDRGIEKIRESRPNLKIDAGTRNTAEKRVRDHFLILKSKDVTKDTMREAILNHVPLGSKEEQVHSALKKCGIGKDKLSAVYPKKDGKIVCRIEYDPYSGEIVHKHYAIIFQLDQHNHLKEVEVKEWLTGP